MNIKQLSKELSKEVGMPQTKCYAIIVALIGLITRSVIKGHEVKLKNLLTIYVDVTPERKIYSPIHKETITLKRRFALRIKPSIVFKRKINEKKTY